MNASCINCDNSFSVQTRDLEFYKSIETSPPNYCPQCREARRMAWCNEGTLYFDSCALCKKRVMSQFSPASERVSYCRDCWWSEKWDPKEHALEINFNYPLFSQLNELLKTTPHCHIHTDLSSENSDYCHHAGHQKNCYMTFHCSFAEDCYYGYGIKKVKNCVDCHYCHESELCYECVDIYKGYDLAWCQECRNCSSSRFLYDCIACKNCFLCAGLRNQEYCFLNKKLTREEYIEQTSNFNLASWQVVKKLLLKYKDLISAHSRKNLQMLMTENCVGNNLYNARDCYLCFDSSDSENCSYCSQIQFGAKYCYDIYQFGINIERCYECSMIGYNIYNCHFCYDLLEQCSDLQYCLSCHSSKDCFACYGLKKAQYCILNKQYSKEQYFELRYKIIEKMRTEGTYGSFFPISMSPHAYNETIAYAWYPKSKEQIQSLGLRWQDNLPYTSGLASLKQIPDVADPNITKEILCCVKCNRDFRLTLPEFNFYRRNKIPIPRECYYCRRQERHKSRDSRKIVARKCQRCKVDTLSTLLAPRNVLCEQCYAKIS